MNRDMELRRMFFALWIFLSAVGVMVVIGSPTLAGAADKRHKAIEFEDEVVEGMNKRPLDYVSEIAEKERNGARTHLYRKRVGFRQETQLTLREMRFSP